jgi:hypothetical protein
MGRFMQTLRLATAATSVERMVWLGEPSMIHVQPQEAWPQVEDIGDTWWRRVVTLTPDHLPGLRRLAAMVDRLEFPAAAKKKKGAWLVPPLAGRPGRGFGYGARDTAAPVSNSRYLAAAMALEWWKVRLRREPRRRLMRRRLRKRIWWPTLDSGQHQWSVRMCRHQEWIAPAMARSA